MVFLDDTGHTFSLDKRCRGQALLDAVFAHLDLRTERDHFGLVFAESGGPLSSCHEPDAMRWLDPSKPLRKQLRTSSSLTQVSFGSKISGNSSPLPATSSPAPGAPMLYFRVKFYVTGKSRANLIMPFFLTLRLRIQMNLTWNYPSFHCRSFTPSRRIRAIPPVPASKEGPA